MESIKEILVRETKLQPGKKLLKACPPDTKKKTLSECAICNDAGVVHPVIDGRVDFGTVIPCVCREKEIKKRRAENLLRYCQLPAKTENKTLETFEIRNNYCKLAKEKAIRIAKGDESVIFLTLISETGRGKSHLAIAICREWLRRGEGARYAYVPELLDDIRDSYRKDENTGQSYSQLMEFLGTVPILVMDDLGTEKKSDWACEKLQSIVDRRARSALPLVVTTNKQLGDLPNDDEGRLSSRLQREDWCHVVAL